MHRRSRFLLLIPALVVALAGWMAVELYPGPARPVWESGPAEAVAVADLPGSGGSRFEVVRRVVRGPVWFAGGSLHPLYVADGPDQALVQALWPSLDRLAARWQASRDGQVWEVTLRPHRFWADGAAVTARDVAFTYAALRLPGYRGPFAATHADLLRVEAEGPYRLRFALARPDPDFPQRPGPGIVPQHVLVTLQAAVRPDLWSETIPTAGPYRVQGHLNGGVRVVESNPYWMGPAPEVERLYLLPRPGPSLPDLFRPGT